ncbi:hypothetical protein [Pseudomonas sp. FG-3G]|nr:hypothetical protein [Pseudomonas sp. FG-3G]
MYLARGGYTGIQKAALPDTDAIPHGHSMASIEAAQHAPAEKHTH